MAATAAAGFATAALVGVALARTFTLQVARGATVNGQRENIVVDSRGFAVYTLTGDSRRHALCTKRDGCFRFWAPVTAASAKKLSKGAGVKGRLGAWRRDGFRQVTLAGHPLYRFVQDTHRRDATGDGIRSFGGTWHVVRVGGGGGSGARSSPQPRCGPVRVRPPAQRASVGGGWDRPTASDFGSWSQAAASPASRPPLPCTNSRARRSR